MKNDKTAAGYCMSASLMLCSWLPADGIMLQQGVTDIDWRDVVLETKIGAGGIW